MIKPTIYLDTSVINFLFADDAPEKKEITVDFFENFVKLGIYDTVVSVYVVDELLQTPNEIEREKLKKVITSYNIPTLPAEPEDEIAFLAELYLERGIMPPKKYYDALHVAFCTVHKHDYLVSWNFKHLANVNRERRVLALNMD